MCRSWQAQLSRRHEDLLVLLDSIRSSGGGAVKTLPSASLPAPSAVSMKMAM
jgi:hypothetical protein